MLGTLSGRGVRDREAAGVAAATIAVVKGARIVRTHDVSATMTRVNWTPSSPNAQDVAADEARRPAEESKCCATP